MKKCLVVGSLNMDYTVYLNGDFPVNGETCFGRNRFIQPGGKGENQAIALAKSKMCDVTMIGAIGNDSDGNIIKDTLIKYGVKPMLKVCEDVETGNATIVIDKNSENKIIIIEGSNGKLTSKDIDLKLFDEMDYLIIQNEISEEVNEFCIKEAKARNKIVIYNPAPYREIKEELYSYIDYFIPNEIELKMYTKLDDINESIDYLLSKGIKNVLVTLGTQGSLFKSKDKEIKVGCYKVNAIDTVAAGDTYVGYFTSSLASGYSIQESMDIASKASSITVSRKGSVISIPYKEEVFK